MTVNMEIICVGNELLIGKIENTNATWLVKQATPLGVNVRRVTVIQDNLVEIANALNEALQRKPQFIVTTGGLGPTFDDMTLQGIAKALNRKLTVNPKALEIVKQKCIEYAQKRQMPTEIEMTPPRVKMATLPAGTEPVVNPIGTAPGVNFKVQGATVFVLPGVPQEMEAIFTQTIAPLLREAVGDHEFCERSLFVDNIFESKLAPLIDQVMACNAGVYVKSHPVRTENKPHLELHLTANLKIEEKAAEKLKKAANELAVLIEKNGGKVSV
jgi:nicotinamide-nucleotide amidase